MRRSFLVLLAVALFPLIGCAEQTNSTVTAESEVTTGAAQSAGKEGSGSKDMTAPSGSESKKMDSEMTAESGSAMPSEAGSAGAN